MSDKLSMQETFEKVSRHLFAQGHRAMRDDDQACAYRAMNGDKCAIGCLIPNHMYRAYMEGKGSYSLFSRYPELWDLFQAPEDQRTNFSDWAEFFGSLQEVHDHAVNWDCTSNLRTALERVGVAAELDTDFLSSLSLFPKET